MPSANNITPPRVPLTDPRTGLISREWYMFFVSLFELTGAGQNQASITDLQVGPPVGDADELDVVTKAIQGLDVTPLDAVTVAQIAAMAKQVQGLQEAPPDPGMTATFLKAIQALSVAPQAPATTPVDNLAPPSIPNTNGRVMTNTATLDFPNTAAQASSDLTISVPGAVVGDVVSLGVDNAAVLANSSFSAWVSAPDTVTVRYNNYSSAAQNPASGVFRAMVTRL